MRPVESEGSTILSIPSKAAPIQQNERVEQMDILRGIALLGVLTINLLGEFRVSIFQQFVDIPPAEHALDRWINTYTHVFIELKAFALFSLLFGIGLAIQFDRISMRGGSPFRLLTRRLLALLLLGIIHLTLVWNGDILTEYAIAGLIALPFLFLPRRWLVVATLLFTLQYLLPFVPYPISFPTDAWLQLHLNQAAMVYKHGNYLQILSFEWHELPELLPLHVFIIARTIALFLFGALCWRSGVVKRLDAHRRTLALACLLGLGIGLSLTILTSSLVKPMIFGRAQSELYVVAELALTIGYAATIMYVTTKAVGLKLLGWAAPLGRMAFTNYVMQSIIFSFLFFGWGLGLFGMRSGPALLLGISIYVLQVIVSAAWLRRFRFGPIEWLWRTMMYGVIQPMKRTSETADTSIG
ncbi:DUF418 domain-containing protein [Granulicella arctica]|uniref:DUF418 domain-containing protein n=1 Tax=Granulicella arctica TaxID=940613 RepID=UPI0021E07BB8|nr:DUF418 domain-containing protein [Granulicella arctica]